MRHLLTELGEEIQARLAEAKTPRERLSAVIRGNFAAGQFRPAVISAWLAFYVQAQNDPEARRLLHVYTRRLESNLAACAPRADHARARAPRSPRPPPR